MCSFFHLTCFQDSSMLSQVSVFHAFLCLNNNSLYGFTIHHTVHIILYHSMGWYFIFLWCALTHKFFILMKSNLPLFVFACLYPWSKRLSTSLLYLRDYHQAHSHEVLCLCFLLRFIVLVFILRSLLNFEFSFENAKR
jgi:hypothetical protein